LNDQIRQKWLNFDENSVVYQDWAYKIEFQYNKKERRIELTRTDPIQPKINYEFKQKPSTLNDANIFKIGEYDHGYPYISMKWFREDCLVTSTFVTQTNLQHLGFTSTHYPFPKKYELQPNQTNFTLSIFSKSDMIPVEFDEDGKDYIVLECLFFRE
jgi:hypothetical protein